MSRSAALSLRFACMGLLSLSAAACVQDVDTVLEPDPADGLPPDAMLPDGAPGVPAIEVDPPMLVLDGPGAAVELTLRSAGGAPLTIDRITLRGDPGFVVAHGGRNVALLGPDAVSGEGGLAPGAAMVLSVEAMVGPPAATTLVIESDDPDRPAVEVPVGFGDAPCLEARPMSLDFGDVQIGDEFAMPVEIVNCSAAPMPVHRVALSDESDPQFELTLAPDAARILAPGEHFQAAVVFSGRREGPVRGALLVEGDGAAVRVPITARSRAAQCPVALVPDGVLQVELGDTVVLDGGTAVDVDGPEGRPIAWEWLVVQRPPGSTAGVVESFADPLDPDRGGLDDDPSTPTALFAPDLFGTYAFELRVSDAEGCTDSAITTLETCPCEDDGLVIELDWTTREGQPAGSGVDLDLHLLHPLGPNWFTAPYDCHYANAAPDWGALDDPIDDPTLNADMVGAGVERTVLRVLEETEPLGGPYLVGVHHNFYRRGNDGAPAPEGGVEARLRVHVGGALRFDSTQVLTDDQLWDAVEVHWPDARVEPRGRIYEGRP